MTAANHLTYLRHCYLENRLAKGKAKFGGKTLNLSKVTIPIYHLATREDHIAPAKSVFIGAKLLAAKFALCSPVPATSQVSSIRPASRNINIGVARHRPASSRLARERHRTQRKLVG